MLVSNETYVLLVKNLFFKLNGQEIITLKSKIVMKYRLEKKIANYRTCNWLILFFIEDFYILPDKLFERSEIL